MKKQFIFALLLTSIVSLAALGQKASPLPTAGDVFQKYADAVGGKEAFAKITSRIYRGTLEIPAMSIAGTFQMSFQTPNKNLVSLNLNGYGENLSGFDGSTAWARDPIQGLRTKSPAELEYVKSTSDFYYSVNLEKIYPAATVTGTQKIDNSDVYVVKANDNVTLYFDRETNLLVKSERFIISPQGKMPASTVFSDYREVDKIKYPFTWRQSIHGGEMIMKISEVRHNPEIDGALFTKPK